MQEASACCEHPGIRAWAHPRRISCSGLLSQAPACESGSLGAAGGPAQEQGAIWQEGAKLPDQLPPAVDEHGDVQSLLWVAMCTTHRGGRTAAWEIAWHPVTLQYLPVDLGKHKACRENVFCAAFQLRFGHYWLQFAMFQQLLCYFNFWSSPKQWLTQRTLSSSNFAPVSILWSLHHY